jgi:hypothetical protein
MKLYTLTTIQIIYWIVILLMSVWIIFYGSVYETEYNKWIYILGDEYLVIALLFMISMTIIYYDLTMGLLSLMIIFFITNDIPILRNQVFYIKNKEQNESFVNDNAKDNSNKNTNEEILKGADASAKYFKNFMDSMTSTMQILKKTTNIKNMNSKLHI